MISIIILSLLLSSIINAKCGLTNIQFAERHQNNQCLYEEELKKAAWKDWTDWRALVDSQLDYLYSIEGITKIMNRYAELNNPHNGILNSLIESWYNPEREQKRAKMYNDLFDKIVHKIDEELLKKKGIIMDQEVLELLLKKDDS
jgi:hypothetical protein